MAKKTVAIVSSYKVDCGIAFCAERTEASLKRHFDVEVLPVDLELLRSLSPKHIVKAGDAHIAQIASRLKDYDFVNIQMEAGVYGRFYEIICPRVRALIEGARGHVIMTMHCGPHFPWLSKKEIAMAFLKYSFLAPAVIYMKSSHVFHTRRLWNFMKQKAVKGELSFVVFNKFEKECLARYYDMPGVYDYPLCLLSDEECAHARTRISKKDFKARYGLAETDVMIGAFGFFVPYKGFSDVIHALPYLPPHYKLVLCGGTNLTIFKEFSDCDPYLRSLLGLIRALQLEDRVIFTGTLSEEDLNSSMAHSDIAVLSYFETHQVASGPMTLAIALAEKIITTSTRVFDYYEQYYPGRISGRYTTGNHLALAQMIEEVQALPTTGAAPRSDLNINGHTDLYRSIWEKSVS